MKLIRFILRESRSAIVFTAIASFVSGLSNTLLLALTGSILSGSPKDLPSRILLKYFALSLLMLVGRFGSEMLLIRFSLRAVHELRMHLCRRILAAPLRRLEEIGSHRLLATLTEDVPVIINALMMVPRLCMHISITAACIGYMAWLSPRMLVVVLGMILVAILCYQVLAVRARYYLMKAREEWDRLLKYFEGVTQGTKELKLNQRRRHIFLNHDLRNAADAVRHNNMAGTAIFAGASSLGHFAVFALIGVIVLVLPRFSDVQLNVITGYAIVILFMMTPVEFILSALPLIGRANVAIRKVEQLGLSLTASLVEDCSEATGSPEWRRLELAGVTHTYKQESDDRSFTLGPINLVLNPGEMILIVGGNGSGKTTLAKLITGLYVPESGNVLLDYQAITDDNREMYRQLFAAVFWDFYLFERACVANGAQLDAQASEYAVKLDLHNKVRITDGLFSSTDLSQGQRKRLALISAYLDDRPILLFDEWAADQDPFFKNLFYTELLKELKERGKTLLVISHDEKYYGIADRIIKLEHGRICQDTHSNAPLRDTSLNDPQGLSRDTQRGQSS